MKFFIKYTFIISVVILSRPFCFSQNYTSYFTGNTTDAITNPGGGICLMGGATEHDEAMKWFLQQTDGGDILVLRATGTNGYNNYLYSTLGVAVNSVETIVCNNAAASSDPYVIQRIAQAEGIWFAGGDQWDYISYWRNTAVDSCINAGIKNRKIVIGGISAGMAIQGKFYFTAENGTVTSSTALADPYTTTVTVDSTAFIQNSFLTDVITDTHYDNPDRKGRHLTFLARILTDYGITAKGIACDEYTAVCIDTSGLAKVYGDFPAYDDIAYFIQPNCELSSYAPENCTAGSTLDWDLGGQALKVYKVNGTATGSNTFNLNDWTNGSGGTWEVWSATGGSVTENSATQINCISTGLTENRNETTRLSIFPNPCKDLAQLNFSSTITQVIVCDVSGKMVHAEWKQENKTININQLHPGIYYVKVITGDQIATCVLIKSCEN